MKNMKVKVRMFVTIGLILLLSVITIVVAEVASTITDGNYLQVISRDMNACIQLLNVRANTNNAGRLIRDMIINGYDATQDQRLTNNLANADAAIEHFVDSYALGDNRAQTYREHVVAWETEAKEILALLKSGETDEAGRRLRETCTPAMATMNDESESLTTAVNSMVTDSVNSARSVSKVAMAICIGLTVFSLVLAIILAIRMIQDITHPMAEAEKAMIAMSKGDLEHQTEYHSENELGKMVDAVRTSQKVLKDAVSDISNVMAEMANGNYDVKLTASFPGDLAPIATSVEQMISRMEDTIRQIVESAEQVAAGAEQVSIGAQSLAQSSTEQASSAEELTTSVSEVSESAKANAVAADNSRKDTNAAGEELNVCSGHMKDMVAAMSDISKSSEEISKIISTIENIAFNTNILALNAAVEAARAGSAGKGFAVVADEVRNLASKSDEAAKATKDLIESSLATVNRGTSIVGQVSDALEKALELAGKAVSGMDMIADAVDKESVAIAQITDQVDQISAVVQTNSATSEQSAAASEELSSQAALMRQVMSGFRVRQSGGALPVSSHTEAPAHTSTSVSSGVDKY